VAAEIWAAKQIVKVILITDRSNIIINKLGISLDGSIYSGYQLGT